MATTWRFPLQAVVAWGERTLVMAVVNTTPDSFSDGSRHGTAADAVAGGLQAWRAGADILDIGGESTRPGAALKVHSHPQLKQCRVMPQT